LTPEQRAKLFTPFVQLSQVPRNGHGLGLSIVYRIVNKKLGGYVGVESTGIPRQGSTFYFTLPGTNNDPVDRDIVKRL
jgi:signal transduction histidine kinase